MNLQREKRAHRLRRKFRARKHIQGTSERPRLSVFRSLKQFYCQLIDDISGRTLVNESTRSAAYSEASQPGPVRGSNCQAAQRLGILLAKKAKEQGISKIVFDRSGCRYHGRVKALAESLRKEGMQF